MLQDTYVEHKGHRHAICAVPFKTEADADDIARRTCGDAMRTDIILVPAGAYSGSVIKSYNRGQPGDTDLYRNLNAAMEVLSHSIHHHADQPAQTMKALTISSLMPRAKAWWERPCAR